MHPQFQTEKITTKRKLTISDKYFPRVKKSYAVFPAIRLSGKWLQQAGFTGGQRIEVLCRQNKLIITIAENEEMMGKVKKPVGK